MADRQQLICSPGVFPLYLVIGDDCPHDLFCVHAAGYFCSNKMFCIGHFFIPRSLCLHFSSLTRSCCIPYLQAFLKPSPAGCWVRFSMHPFPSISRSMPELVDEARSVSSKSYYIGGVCLTMNISGWTWEGFCNFWSREIRLVSFFMQGPKVLMNLACVVFFPPPCLLGSSAVRKGCWIGLLGLISRQSFGVICTSFISWFNRTSLQIVNILELCCWV